MMKNRGQKVNLGFSFPLFICVLIAVTRSPLLVQDGSEVTARPEDSAQPQHESHDQIGMYIVLAEARIW
jgi:hypothetical protein